MHAIRDRLYDKISRFFSDSEASNETLDQETQASADDKGGNSNNYILTSFLSSANFDWFRPNAQSDEVKSTRSDSFKWRSRSFSLKDKPLDRSSDYANGYEANEDTRYHGEHGNYGYDQGSNQNHEPLGNHLENGEPGCGTSTSSGSDVFEDVYAPRTFEKSMPNLKDESIFISPDLYQFFVAALPNIVKGCQWVLLYSTVRHGISLNTLYRKSIAVTGPCLLITGDKQGAVFGGLIECPLKPTAKRKYQGTNQSFVFTTIYGDPRLFRPTGANRYFYLCLNESLALGGGANFALCLNEDLLSGSSGPCETFGNMCLAHDQEFEVKNVELWGFVHSSQYIFSDGRRS